MAEKDDKQELAAIHLQEKYEVKGDGDDVSLQNLCFLHHNFPMTLF